MQIRIVKQGTIWTFLKRVVNHSVILITGPRDFFRGIAEAVLGRAQVLSSPPTKFLLSQHWMISKLHCHHYMKRYQNQYHELHSALLLHYVH